METKELTGKFYDIQGFSVHDGPGIRLTLFLKGCPLRCPWCHSPESQEFYTELNWMEMKCVGTEKCGNCLNVCPHDAISLGKQKKAATGDEVLQLVTVDRTKCDTVRWGIVGGVGQGDQAGECPPKASGCQELVLWLVAGRVGVYGDHRCVQGEVQGVAA